MRSGRGTEVVCSILEDDSAATLQRARRAPAGCSRIEIRADRLRTEEIGELVRRVARPLVVSARRVEDGGHFDRSESERRGLLTAALDAGADLVDVELGGTLEDLASGERAGRVVLSHHGAACREASLRPLLRGLFAARAARLKLVPTASSPAQLGAVRSALAQASCAGRPLACFASGRAGAPSRLLCAAWGSWATYGSAPSGVATAPGQFPVSELLDVYDVGGITQATRRFALLGSDLSASPSPAMHCAGFRAAGIDARYFPLELEPERFEECRPLLGAPRAFGLEGLGVTMPFKQRVARYCARLDPIAAASGAVNTVRLAADGWVGYNTDGPAIAALARSRLDPQGARVAIVGAGGTGRAAAASLARAGARITLYNRTVERARLAARELGVAARDLAELPAARWDLLVQATPLGGAGEQVLPAERLTGRVVIDAVYRAETPLVRDARRRGLAVFSGFELLVGQAERQFELLTGVRVAAGLMRRAGAASLESQPAAG